MSKVNEFNEKQEDPSYERQDEGPLEEQSPPPYTRHPSNNESGAGPSRLPLAPAALPLTYLRRRSSSLSLNLPPPCNYLVERKSGTNINGTWHVDTAMTVPPVLLQPFAAFDGAWNTDVQNARRKRDKEQRKRDGWRSKITSGERPELPMINEVRPNLMLYSTCGGVSGKVHVAASDGVMRHSLVVAEAQNGSVGLTVYTVPGQPLRVHATSTNGSVNVKIPSSFQGTLIARATNGSIKLSDGIQSKLTTFSSTSNSTRCFIGNWQAARFVSSALPNTDPFQTWAGPSIFIASTNGSVSLSCVRDAQRTLTTAHRYRVKTPTIPLHCLHLNIPLILFLSLISYLSYLVFAGLFV